MAILGTFGLYKSQEAQSQATIATARQLAVQALTCLDDQLDLALLLSLEATRMGNTVEARSSLLAGVEHHPHLTTFLHSHDDKVSSVAFSPDGQTLASGSQDNTIILWDVASGQPLGQPLTGHNGVVRSVAFSPDGQTLASGGWDIPIILWDVSFESWEGRACSRANRNLTHEEWGQYIGDEPYRATCPDLPVPED